MQNISQLTTEMAVVVDALKGRWDRHVDSDGITTWIISGQLAFVEGDYTKFPFDVIQWHTIGTMKFAILGEPEEGHEDGGTTPSPTPTPTPTPTNYYTKEEIDAMLAVIEAGIESHLTDYENPHKVTAEQVGAATPSDVSRAVNQEAIVRQQVDDDLRQELTTETAARTYADEVIKYDVKVRINNYGIEMREGGTNTLQFYRPTL